MSNQRNRKPWNTPDFESRFREAMGRKMTPQEREFFGLSEERSEGEDEVSPDRTSDRAEFAWQALRRISALVG